MDGGTSARHTVTKSTLIVDSSNRNVTPRTDLPGYVIPRVLAIFKKQQHERSESFLLLAANPQNMSHSVSHFTRPAVVSVPTEGAKE